MCENAKVGAKIKEWKLTGMDEILTDLEKNFETINEGILQIAKDMIDKSIDYKKNQQRVAKIFKYLGESIIKENLHKSLIQTSEFISLFFSQYPFPYLSDTLLQKLPQSIQFLRGHYINQLYKRSNIYLKTLKEQGGQFTKEKKMKELQAKQMRVDRCEMREMMKGSVQREDDQFFFSLLEVMLVSLKEKQMFKFNNFMEKKLSLIHI
eukprot:TRINITY_DN6270_c0_g1_i2.p2 TRINITY_DN6270_c0_g1~~TRINITY_DN6270_c0_g1_i2.p2  ORF type:complete len:208 (-),score=31.97 TRINITY_DN6270_c0_g1_i2:136-759(-)